LVTGIRLGWALRKGYRRQLDDDGDASLGGPWLNERSRALVQRAEELADGGPDDQAAAAELAAMGDRHEYDLRVAIAHLAHWHHVDRVHDQAWRVALGAQHAGPVPAIAESDETRFLALEAWEARSESERFAMLVDVEPRLAGIVEVAREEDYDRLPLPAQLQAVVDARGPEAVAELLAGIPGGERQLRVRSAVDALLGPGSDHRDDPVAGSAAAAFFAYEYLRDLV
jgi:hypothetical protein